MIKELQLEGNSHGLIVEKHKGMIYRLALSHTANKTDAEDIMQDVFLKFVRANPAFNDDEHEKAWFIRCTINTAKSFHLSSWRKRIVLLPTNEIECPVAANYSECTKLSQAVFKLDSKKRMCIHLFYYEDCSVAKIAELTGFKESTVRSHLKRAREKLKLTLGESKG